MPKRIIFKKQFVNPDFLKAQGVTAKIKSCGWNGEEFVIHFENKEDPSDIDLQIIESVLSEKTEKLKKSNWHVRVEEE